MHQCLEWFCEYLPIIIPHAAAARGMNLLVVKVWHAQKNVLAKHRCGPATVLFWYILLAGL